MNFCLQIRESNWQIKGTPSDLQDRRVEITGPVDRKMVINALNSGAKVYMADFEDSSTPTWRNLIDGQKNLIDAVRNQVDFIDAKSDKKYALKPNHGVLMVRPRGWHLPEKHFFVDHRPMSGSLFDFGLFFFHNAQKLIENGTGPYFYLPKMENHLEAQLWDDVFRYAQDELKIPHGTIKATVLIEHIMAAFECEEILHALKDHIVGLNCGRWDYIFSYIKVFRNRKNYMLPDRSLVTMTTPFMRAYAKHVIKICHKHGAHAMGGMAANIPIKNDPKANETALGLVRADKEREVNDGHDGTWVAHPGLVPLASEMFNKLMPQPNQVHRQFPETVTTVEDLLACPAGLRTEQGLRRIISVTLGYLEAWLRGVGCVPLFNLMEDAATAEISRALIWHWLRHSATLNDGRVVTMELIERLVNEEMNKLAKELLPNSPTLKEAADLVLDLIEAGHLEDFLTLKAYDHIVAKGQ